MINDVFEKKFLIDNTEWEHNNKYIKSDYDDTMANELTQMVPNDYICFENHIFRFTYDILNTKISIINIVYKSNLKIKLIKFESSSIFDLTFKTWL